MDNAAGQGIKRKFNAENYNRLYADLPKELVARFKAAAKERGDTIANVIRKAIERYLEQVEIRE